MNRLVLLVALVLAPLVGTAGAGGTAAATLTARGSDYGTILFDGRGYVLYAFPRDGKSRSACSGACAAAWPPYLVKSGSKLRAGNGGKAALLGATLRAGGKLQVTYAGRPLYYYVGDNGPGVIRCQNVNEYGGDWLVVAPSGRLIR